jgi:DNA-binding response OmpR family regulator
VLFISGYSGSSFASGSALPEGAELLPKPFLSDDLERRIRALLERT